MSTSVQLNVGQKVSTAAEVAALKSVKSIHYDANQLTILDQRLLPAEKKWTQIRTVDDAFTAIKEMQVRGAPAIAIVGLLGLAVELHNLPDVAALTIQSLNAFVHERLDYLVKSRPTAVNLRNEIQKALLLADDCLRRNVSVPATIIELIALAESLLVADVCANVSLGEYGRRAFVAGRSPDARLNVLTICNTGGLATAAHGTALGVARSLHEAGRLERLYFMETRPYLQGARLTALECKEDKIPATMICDNMVGWLMARNNIHAVIVGCDHVARNGDTANKIGTYTTALAAREHGVPFYVAMPTSTFNAQMPDGSQIVVEERHAHEVLHVRTVDGQSVAITNLDVDVWNPAFDVTPARLVTGGYVTEYGVFQANELASAYESGWKTPQQLASD